MSIFEYDEEDVLRQIREDEFAQGRTLATAEDTPSPIKSNHISNI